MIGRRSGSEPWRWRVAGRCRCRRARPACLRRRRPDARPRHERRRTMRSRVTSAPASASPCPYSEPREQLSCGFFPHRPGLTPPIVDIYHHHHGNSRTAPSISMNPKHRGASAVRRHPSVLTMMRSKFNIALAAVAREVDDPGRHVSVAGRAALQSISIWGTTGLAGIEQR